MKINDIRLLPLYADAREGWTTRFGQIEQIHTLVEVITDGGVTGLGSVFASLEPVRAAIDLLRPFLIGASARDPAATSEQLHQKWAIETAKMLADHDVSWFEEPLRPDDLDGYVRLTEHSPVPIAGCEVLTRRQSFLPWIERQAVDYIQPDVTKVGGLSEQHRIGQYADDHAILMVPHGWNTAVGLAADLQLVAAAGNARWVEYITPAPYIEELCATPLRMDQDGLLQIPDGPGLGFEWNPDGIAKLTRGIKLTPSK